MGLAASYPDSGVMASPPLVHSVGTYLAEEGGRCGECVQCGGGICRWQVASGEGRGRRVHGVADACLPGGPHACDNIAHLHPHREQTRREAGRTAR